MYFDIRSIILCSQIIQTVELIFSYFLLSLGQIEVTVSDDGVMMRMVEEPVNMG